MTGHFLDPLSTVPLVFTVVGAVFVVVGLRTLVGHLALRRRAWRADGVVVGLRRQRGHRGRTYYYPPVAFRTADGRDVEAQAGVGTSWRHHRAGDRLPVLYDPRDPARVYLGRGAAPALMGLFFAGFGAVFATVGSALVIASGLPTWLSGGG